MTCLRKVQMKFLLRSMPKADETERMSSKSRRPRVLVTRPILQNQNLVKSLSMDGFEPVIFPLLKISPFNPLSSSSEGANAERFPKLVDVTQRLSEFSKVIFISTNAAAIACEWFDMYWPDLPSQHWFAIGAATLKALNQQNLFGMPKVTASTLGMNSEALLALNALRMIRGEKILIVRGCGGRETLKNELESRGAQVEYMEVYRRESVAYPSGELASELKKSIDIITVSSGETLDNLEQLAIMEEVTERIHHIPVVVPGTRVANLAMQKKYHRVVTAENAGLAAMMTAIKSIT